SESITAISGLRTEVLVLKRNPPRHGVHGLKKTATTAAMRYRQAMHAKTQAATRTEGDDSSRTRTPFEDGSGSRRTASMTRSAKSAGASALARWIHKSSSSSFMGAARLRGGGDSEV